MIPGRVSIIVPCYNAAKYLDDAIHSVQAQTYDNFEILAVNDGSKDDTQKRLEEHASIDPRVRMFQQANAGPSAARNTAMRNITGEYISFLDADDVFLPEKLERQVAFLTAHPHVDLVHSDYYTSDAELNLTALTATRPTHVDTIETVAMRNSFPPSVPMFRRRLMETVGPFDEAFRMTEDWDYWIRCAKAGVFAYQPGAVVIYRTHGEQAHHDLDRMFRAGKKVLWKHFKSDLAFHQRALASWYAVHAKARWATAQHAKTGLFLAFSAIHKRIGAAAARFTDQRTTVHARQPLNLSK